MMMCATTHREDIISTTPQRSCVVCRQSRPLFELLRLYEKNGAVIIGDPTGGRGAWICYKHPCLEKLDARLVSKALRKPVVVCEPNLMRKALVDIAQQKIFTVLGLARRQGILIVGQDQLDKQTAACIILAKDASSRVQRAFAKDAFVFANSNELSRAIGLKGVFVLGIAKSSFAKQAAYWLTVWYEGQTRDSALPKEE
ncbi:MAG: DUF448 domain-containing protein [Deltaproteobacteria bacterium]|nr:DUF448 domain-containing protein [Deltaproteobacteria bacterium]